MAAKRFVVVALATLAACAQPVERGLKAGSPLWCAIAAENFARVDEAFGTPITASAPNWPTKVERHAVIPETVDVGGFAIGRFEVTRAQWATFRPETKVEAKTENLPIAGVSFDDARAYCEWLTKSTGAAWRLPTVTELTTLCTLVPRAGADENTLARWNGGAGNDADAVQLVALADQKLMAPDDSTSPLILPVGSCPPTRIMDGGRTLLLFDLAGNVAEWATVDGEAKSARAVGGCALTFDAAAPPPPRAIGLRVVRVARERPAKSGS
jgi:formylglycine-generating enzyme required for sulfatase activity